MKKWYLILSISCLVVLLWFLSFIPTIQIGMKVNELSNLKQERARCEELQLNASTKAKQLREELGLQKESWITPTQTGIEIKSITE